MNNSNDDDRSGRATKLEESENSAYLPFTTFEGHILTRVKKLRSPARSNESSASMPTPIPALVNELDDQIPTYKHYEDESDADDDDDDDEIYEDEASDSGSSTPKASRQSFNAYSSDSPPAYITTTDSTIAGSGWQAEHLLTSGPSRQTKEQDLYSLSSTLPAHAYSPSTEDRHRYRYRDGRNGSISSMGTARTGQSEQEVLDAMIDDLSRTHREAEDEDGDDSFYEQRLDLKPVRSLRRERRK